jgi:predicted outer membrane repeat protein
MGKASLSAGLHHARSVACAVAVGLAMVAIPCRAANFAVDRTDDAPAATACTAGANDCSLRGAILAANALAASASPEASDIALPAGTYALTQSSSCTYRLNGETFNRTSTQVSLCINAEVDLVGDGAGTTVIDAGSLDGVIFVSADAVVEIESVTIRKGSATQPGFAGAGNLGGGVNNQGTVTLTDVVVRDSTTNVYGGGIYSARSLTLVRSAVELNTASGHPTGQAGGAGIFLDSGSTATISDSTIAGNTAEHSGGGIYAHNSSFVVFGSAIAGNTATFSTGGGIHLSETVIMGLSNSTLSGNRARERGGALYTNSPRAQANLASVTITGNSAGTPILSGMGGGIGGSAVVRLKDSILAGNTLQGPFPIGPDCWASTAITSQGYNLIQSTTGCPIAGDMTGNLTGVDPVLGPLADNGGPTETHALLGGSPAIDAGDPAGCTDHTGTLLLVDQTGEPRTADGDGDGRARCDIGSVEIGGGAVLDLAIHPIRGGNEGSITVLFYASGLAAGAEVTLARAGEADIVGQDVEVAAGGDVLGAVFDLTGRTLGAWDAVLLKPGGSPQTVAGAFTIEPARAPELWADFVGPTVMRVGRPTSFHLLYGNRGNVDVFGVPLVIGLPREFAFEARVDVVPPPGQPGLPPIDWSRVPITMGSPLLPGVQAVSLLLPAVPAGFAGTIEIQLTAGTAAVGRRWELPFAIGEPYAGSPDAVARLVAGARAYARRVLDAGISRERIAEMEAFLALQLEEILSIDVHRLLLGAPEPRAVPHLVVGLAAAFGSAAEICTDEIDNDGDNLIDEADPDCQAEDDEDDDEEEEDDEDDDGEEECEPEEAENPWYGDDDCDGEPDCKEGGFNTCAPKPCEKWPPTACGGEAPAPIVLNSHDPNDKVGSPGAGDGQFVTGVDPLRYTVQFENLPAATAPAQDVVITDPLDPTVMDLPTLSLGPIGFGDRLVVPPPGLSSFSTDVDLRPEQDLLVRIEASLEVAAGVLTWRFTSLDPTTGEPPTDPLAGFLPPNLSPPEGQGSVLFTVDPVGSLPTGTEIRNQASIVFDFNEPILTPEWLNTIDVEDPSSQVASAVARECSQAIQVTWSGSDPGSGIASYDVFVSEDGRPFGAWQNDVVETSATFLGEWGKTYAFYSRARDRTGNVEDEPVAADASATVADCGPFDLAVTKIFAPKVVRLSARKRAPILLVKVQIQNRSARAQSIPSLAVLRELVDLEVVSLDGACPTPTPVLLAGKPQKKRPIAIGSKKTVPVAFAVPFGCANDPAQSSRRDPGHEDFELRAHVDQSVLGGTDAFPADDACPRTVAPPGVVVPYPDGKITDRGCGAKRTDKTFGDPVLVDVVDKR